MSANEKYYETRLEIAKELKKLEQSLFDHNQKQKYLHWGHVGDMKHILSQLQELNEGLSEGVE